MVLKVCTFRDDGLPVQNFFIPFVTILGHPEHHQTSGYLAGPVQTAAENTYSIDIT